MAFEHPANMLPENYQLTAPVGLRIGREFLDTFGCHQSSFSSVGFASCKALEKGFALILSLMFVNAYHFNGMIRSPGEVQNRSANHVVLPYSLP
jgi:hypothetical protein